jgi:hypothetical protein
MNNLGQKIQGWGGKNQSGKYRVVFTGFYHQIFPNKTQEWKI